MNRAAGSPYPHHNWFCVRRSISPHEPLAPFYLRQFNHVLFYAETTLARVRWVCRGRDRQFEVPAHAVHFAPADGEEHVRIPQVFQPHDYLMVLIPPQYVDAVVSSEGVMPSGHSEAMLGRHDPVLKTCITRLFCAGHPGDSSNPIAVTEASRRLVLRLAELHGSGRPDWSRDASVFGRRTMSILVDRIDEQLRSAPSLQELAAIVGLSPSHFARKFRLSTGLSLHRFINRRRIRRSLETLRTDSSLASIALDLGFCSQSHFTRLFSDLTGMTPARFRRQFRRPVG